MKRYVCLLAMLFSAHHSHDSAWTESVTTPRGASWIASVTSENEAERSQARKAALEQRWETVQALVSIVDSPPIDEQQFYISTTPRNIAIFLLGRLRAAESVSSLMSWLVPREGQVTAFPGLRLLSPAADALAEIGMPAVQPLLERMKLKGVEPEGRMCLMTMVRILGADLTQAKLEKAIAAETNDGHREKMRACLDALQKKEIPVEKLEEAKRR